MATPFRSLRRITKWFLSLATLVCLSAWLLSLWFIFQIADPFMTAAAPGTTAAANWALFFHRGRVAGVAGPDPSASIFLSRGTSTTASRLPIFEPATSDPLRWYITRTTNPGQDWWFDPGNSPVFAGANIAWIMPLWVPTFVCGLLALWLWRPDLVRKIPPGHCRACRYDCRSLFLQSSPGGGGCRVREAGGGSPSDSVICPECGAKVSA